MSKETVEYLEEIQHHILVLMGKNYGEELLVFMMAIL